MIHCDVMKDMRFIMP